MLKERAISATFWSGVDVLIRQVLQLGVTVVLSRILAPEDFGIWALLLLFSGVAGVLVEGGFGSALVRAESLSDKDTSTVFHTQWIIAQVVAAVLVVSAPLIAGFYGEPVLEKLTWVMALSISIGCFSGVHASLAVRELDFRTQAQVGLAATLSSSLITVGLALGGAGVWSFAGQMLTWSAVTVIAFWLLHPWRPQFAFSTASLLRLFRFGRFVLATGLMNVLDARLYAAVIGKLYGMAHLSYYNRAVGTQQLPSGLLSSTLGQVAFPLFSSIQSDQARLTNALQKAAITSVAVNAPVMLGLAAIAEPTVLLLFGEAWLPSAPILQILCLNGLFWPLQSLNWSALAAIGRSDLFFRLELCKKLLSLTALVFFAPFGLIALAWGQVAVGALSFLINSNYSGRILGYGTAAQLRDACPWLAGAGLMAAAVKLAEVKVAAGPVLELPILLLLGTSAYGAFWLMWNRALAKEVVGLLRMPRRVTVTLE